MTLLQNNPAERIMIKYAFIENFSPELREAAKHTSVHFHTNTTGYLTLHTHDYWEFLIVLHGNLYNKINGKKIVLGKNSISVIRPDDAHLLEPQKNTALSYVNIMVRDELVHKQLNIINPSLYERLLASAEINFSLTDDMVYKIQNKIHQYRLLPLDDTELQENYKMALFLELISIFTDYLFKDKNYPAPLMLLRELFEQRPENLKLKVSDLCRLTQYSRTHLNRLFVQYFNQTPKEYLNNIRMNYACRLLMSTDDTIFSIADTVGFSSYAHFTYAFKELLGMTPGQYRQMHK